MYRYTHPNTVGQQTVKPSGGPAAAPATSREHLQPSTFSLKEISKSRINTPTVEDARIASLKVLALTLLHQVESLENQMAAGSVSELNLQNEVQRFEAAIIRSALAKTGGRQRRAARLLGVKVTTLNTKIKRLKITMDDVE
jgi:DNA-binding NtrC family response regulator